MSICITDFGIAASTADSKNLTRKCGTPGYCPPEIFQFGAFTEKGDVFSVGCIMFKLLTGKKLFAGLNGNEVLNKNHIANP